MNLTLEPIDVLIMHGLAQQMQRLFGVRVIWLTSTDKAAVLQKAFGANAAELDPAALYPYMFLTPTSWAEATDRLGTFTYAKRGVSSVVSDDASRSFNVKLLPLDTTVSVELNTDRLEDVTNFARRWLFARRNNRLAFTVDYGDVSHNVTVELEGTVQIPTRAAVPDVQCYVVIVTLTVHGVTSEATLQSQVITGEIDLTAKVDGDTCWTFPIKRGTE